MKRSKWLVLAVAMGMMALTGGYLVKVRQRVHLGAPGVKVGPGPLYDELGNLVARQSVLLPDEVLGCKGTNMPVTQAELAALPKDTTFGRKMYLKNHFAVVTSVVLMGSDRTSIHQPQFCLVAQDWQIEKTERVLLPMDRPYPYDLHALKLTTFRTAENNYKQPIQVRGIYVYWFVAADRLTPDQGARMWSIARTMLEKGVLEQWAYISYFVTCLPGQEQATFAQLERFIRASAPEFQTVAGQPSAGPRPAAAHSEPCRGLPENVLLLPMSDGFESICCFVTASSASK
jgi:hypothetical protein